MQEQDTDACIYTNTKSSSAYSCINLQFHERKKHHWLHNSNNAVQYQIWWNFGKSTKIGRERTVIIRASSSYTISNRATELSYKNMIRCTAVSECAIWLSSLETGSANKIKIQRQLVSHRHLIE